VLVGPVTRAATDGLFDWGPTGEVPFSAAGKPLRASYLESPRPRPGRDGRRRSAGGAAALDRSARELSALREALSLVTAGRGGVVAVRVGAWRQRRRASPPGRGPLANHYALAAASERDGRTEDAVESLP